MKYLVILALSCLTFKANALSCFFSLDFIVKCENNICKEGFFVTYKRGRSWCKTIPSVASDRKIYAFDGNFNDASSANENRDGYYLIKAMEMTHAYKDFPENVHSFKFGENNQVSLSNKPWAISKLKYPSTEKIESVMADHDSISTQKLLIDKLIEWIFPLILLALIIGNIKFFNSKHSWKFAFAIFLMTVFGLVNLPYGIPAWGGSGLVGFLFLVGLTLVKLFTLIKRKMANKT